MINKTKYNPLIHNRQSIRLKGYDYSKEGLYFITTCCQERAHLFGEIISDEMILNDAGKMVEAEWLALPNRYKNIKLHEFIVMPNHFHSILEITEGATLVVAPIEGQPQRIAPTTVGEIVGSFKSKTTVEYINGVKNLNWKTFNGKVWQRNYHESIIRSENSYINISSYIIKNPANFKEDKFFK